MLLAELEIWHSRPIAPTRRVALGRRLLPVEPAPGLGGLLLGAIVAAHVSDLDDDLLGELHSLLADLEAGRRIAQPRLRHRFQVDRHGLARSRHRLHGHGERLDLDIRGEGRPATQVLGAVYAAGQLPPGVRPSVMEVVRRAIRWHGGLGPDLLTHLTGASGRRTWTVTAVADPARWALDVLGFHDSPAPGRVAVQRQFRHLVRVAHPDHGGERDGAADRIADLAEARRILLTS